MASKKLTVNASLIEDNLPVCPEGYSRKIVQVSPRVYRVSLEHSFSYSYTSEPVETVWGFVKSNGDVVRPSTFEKASREVVCGILDAKQLSPYTSIIPTRTDHSHL